MTNDEYKEFLKYIFNEYIRPRIHRIECYYDKRGFNHLHDSLRHLKRSVDLINYISNHCEDSGDIYRTFTLERLKISVEQIQIGVHENNRIAEKAGFLDALDAYYDEIVEGLAVELFPESEYDLLK